MWWRKLLGWIVKYGPGVVGAIIERRLKKPAPPPDTSDV